MESPTTSSFLDEDLLSFFDGYSHNNSNNGNNNNGLSLSRDGLISPESLAHALKIVNNYNEGVVDLPPLFENSTMEINMNMNVQSPEQQLMINQNQIPVVCTSVPQNLESQSVLINALPVETKVKQEPPYLLANNNPEDLNIPNSSQKKRTISNNNNNNNNNTSDYKMSSTHRPSKKQKQEEEDQQVILLQVDGKEFIKQFKGMTSDELISFRQNHNLSNTQEKELKTHTRKIKNRESAIQSRQRRKQHQDELEDKMKHLAVENKHLEKEVIRLEAQNETLKKELREFQLMVQSIPGLASLYALYKTQSLISDPVAVAFTAACATTAAWALHGNQNELMTVKN